MVMIIAVAQRKGGVGKTTLSVAIAGEFSKRGFDVALIDSDTQRSASHWAELGNLHFPVYEIGLGGGSISKWALDVRGVKAAYVVIDTAPNEREMGAALALADMVLVPCTASGLDLEATARTVAIIGAVRKQRKAALTAILIPNRVDRRTLEGLELVDELHTFGEMVSSPISNRAAFVRAFATGQAIAEFAEGKAADLEIRNLCNLIIRSFPQPPPRQQR